MMYSTSQINRDFLINIEERRDGKRVSRKLVGVSGLINAIGEELANKFIARAYAAINADVCVCKLRRGVQVSFYNH